MSDVISHHGISYEDNSKFPCYKYTLTEDACIYVPKIDMGKFKAVGTKDDKVYVEVLGHCFIVKAGYSWDGCTGVRDTDWNMRASLFHDAMYQVKKCGLPLQIKWWEIDSIFRTIMKQDGANLFQRNLYYYGVRSIGALYKVGTLDSLKLAH